MNTNIKKKASIFTLLSFFCFAAMLILPLLIMFSTLNRVYLWRESYQEILHPILTVFAPVNFILPCMGMVAGILAVKYGRKTESAASVKFSVMGILLNLIVLLIPLLYLFVPRIMTGVVTYKHEEHGAFSAYVCVREAVSRYPENKLVYIIYVTDDIDIYEQYGDAPDQKRLVNFDAFRPGQVLKIEYVNYNFREFNGLFIDAGEITILKDRYVEYKYESEECSDGHLDSF